MVVMVRKMERREKVIIVGRIVGKSGSEGEKGGADSETRGAGEDEKNN
jgi:hypothetical protein